MVGCDECGFDYEELAVADAPLILDGGTALLRDQLEAIELALELRYRLAGLGRLP
jgi:hypothetical protein